MIHACAATEAKSSLWPFTYEPAPLGEQDVDVAITHCGICHSDLHLLDNDWRITTFPFVPGHEIVGRITAIGAGVKHLELGQRVGIGWQCGACHECEFCGAGLENLCRRQRATCVGRHGGFADRVIVDSRFAFALPETLDSAEAAPLLCAGITVHAPLARHLPEKGRRVGVVGIGGLGHLALQFARALGHQVTAISSNPKKEAEAKSLGAHHFAVIDEKRSVNKFKGSFDLLLVSAIGTLDWQLLLELLAPRGKLCLVGVPDGALTIPPFLLIESQKSICGSNIGSPNELRTMLAFAAEHKIRSRIELFPLNEVNEAIRRLRSNSLRYRAVLQMAPVAG
ncbi:MAG TPA: NAD(P)-dependent alcohol dehydrogenase [Candidatus Ozemobacteraceae bacterium]|nr:NAD(P)-dependent alcohol dehydrogenase [Candidatus Ozemobacteraceae bacterium]